jgi:hypothetical protein
MSLLSDVIETAIEEIADAIRKSPDPESAVAKARKALEMDAFDAALDKAADAMLKE